MFVRSRMDRDVTYRKGGKNWVIKAGTVTSINETEVTAKELKSLYGARIEIFSAGYEDFEEPKQFGGSSKPKTVEKVEVKQSASKGTQKSGKALIDSILAEIEGEKEELVIAKEPTKAVEEPVKPEPPKSVEKAEAPVEAPVEEPAKAKTSKRPSKSVSSKKKTVSKKTTRKSKKQD